MSQASREDDFLFWKFFPDIIDLAIDAVFG
jgi:hypothetical protein